MLVVHSASAARWPSRGVRRAGRGTRAARLVLLPVILASHVASAGHPAAVGAPGRVGARAWLGDGSRGPGGGGVLVRLRGGHGDGCSCGGSVCPCACVSVSVSISVAAEPPLPQVAVALALCRLSTLLCLSIPLPLSLFPPAFASPSPCRCLSVICPLSTSSMRRLPLCASLLCLLLFWAAILGCYFGYSVALSSSRNSSLPPPEISLALLPKYVPVCLCLSIPSSLCHSVLQHRQGD